MNLVYKIVVLGITYGIDNLPYTDLDLNINNGTWTIYSYDKYISEIKNPSSQINISNGGNIASGYSFGFSYINDDFSLKISNNNIYFSNREVRLYSIIDSVENCEWVGIINSYDISELLVSFKCTDFIEINNSEIGTKPICLNWNKNCKVIDFKENTENKVPLRQLIINNLITYADNTFAYRTNNIGSEDIFLAEEVIVLEDYEYSKFESDKNYFVKVISGNGTGGFFRVLNYFESAYFTGKNKLWITVEGDISSISTKDDYQKRKNASCIEIVYYGKDSILSDGEVNTINGVYIYNKSDEIKLTSGRNYTDEYVNDHIISLNGLYEENKFNFQNNEKIPATNTLGYIGGVDYVDMNINYSIEKQYLEIIEKWIKSSDKSNIYLGKITIHDFFVSPSGSIGDGKTFPYGTVTINANYSDDITGNYIELKYDLHPDISSDIRWIYRSGTDLIINIYYDNLKIEDGNNLSDKVQKTSIFDSILYRFFCVLQIDHSAINSTNFSDYTVTFDGLYVSNYGLFDVEDIRIDCYGENVTSGKFDTPANTIKYIQKTYGGFQDSDINLTSYSDSSDDYSLMLSYTRPPNIANQIDDLSKINDVIKSMCFDSTLGLYVARDGKYTLKNFLPYSIAYNNNISPDAVFTDANMIDISNIDEDYLTSTVTGFELEYLYNNSSGEYEKKIYVDGFNYDFSTSGISYENNGIYDQIFDFFEAGKNRSRKSNTLKYSSRNIKDEVDAINFVMNLSTHINRPHQYLTIKVPINSSNISLDLLSFISVRDKKITDNIERLGWVVKREIDIKKGIIVLKILLDISATDPFLILIGAIQDSPTLDEVWIDDPNSLNIVNDGDGY